VPSEFKVVIKECITVNVIVQEKFNQILGKFDKVTAYEQKT
jgi:hypothetical protein